MPDQFKRTVFYNKHIELGANIVEFGGWEMPLHYKTGILQEHLLTRKQAGLFDVSHMGRFIISGKNALNFLQHVLTNNAGALEVKESQYTIIPNMTGGAIDDAYLYRFFQDEFLLVVNAANREKDWDHLSSYLAGFDQVIVEDRSEQISMLSLQGPLAKDILSNCIDEGSLPEPSRNSLNCIKINGVEAFVARTGYTGEPICFEIFIDRSRALTLWDRLLQRGAQPVGLGARDTLRLEAGLPLFGHELGKGPEGEEIPIFAINLSRFAVSFSPLKGDFVGRQPLFRQFEALQKIIDRNYTRIDDLPRIIMPVAITGKGVGRQGDKVFKGEKLVGYLTSGTMVPRWKSVGRGIASQLTEDKATRAISLALLNADLVHGDTLEVEIRGKQTSAVIVPYHLRSEAPPFARAISFDQIRLKEQVTSPAEMAVGKVKHLLTRAIDNTVWRQHQCINLIPSEQSPSRGSKLLSIMDPVGRYAEHKKVKAFSETEIYYYQGTKFICEVEHLLENELKNYLGCHEAETRLISGQMANACVFSALVDFLNRADRKSEQRRIRKILNHHIIKGGHLSAQPMGALRDYVSRDPKTEKPAVVNFPVMAENPYMVDVKACGDIIAEHKPELIIFGKSMVLHKEPIAEIRTIVDDLTLDCVIMYDMSHVLGLVGSSFQNPFQEGADLVTGSTHKTFFGTQRGIVASSYLEEDLRYEFWEAVQRRAFPGSVSNHHMGTMLGLLLAAYEMNAFKDEYQKNVINNAKAFALALKKCGLDVEGDPSFSYTETHQVIVNVGYAKGPEIAQRLEENNIIANYQATAEEEGFTASGSLRLGVQEMTRFGMSEADFGDLAQLVSDIVKYGKTAKDEVIAFRQRFLEMQYCIKDREIEELLQKISNLS